MRGAHDPEVPAVERYDPGDPESLRCGDDRSVDHSEPRVRVPRDQLGDANPVGRSRRLDEECSGGEIFEKPELDLRTETSLDEMRYLCEHERRNDEGARIGAQYRSACDVVIIRNVEIRVERAGVYERSGRPNSSASSSSIRLAVSL